MDFFFISKCKIFIKHVSQVKLSNKFYPDEIFPTKSTQMESMEENKRKSNNEKKNIYIYISSLYFGLKSLSIVSNSKKLDFPVRQTYAK